MFRVIIRALAKLTQRKIDEIEIFHSSAFAEELANGFLKETNFE